MSLRYHLVLISPQESVNGDLIIGLGHGTK